MVWIFCPEMTLAQFPESKFWDFCWIFCPEMTLAQFPEFGFFVQNSRIGVKKSLPFRPFHSGDYIIFLYKFFKSSSTGQLGSPIRSK